MRRIVRRTWIALAAILVAELVLWTFARFVPLEWAPFLGAAIPVVGLLALLVAVVRARPTVGETAIAVDVEGRLGDRVSSALELAVGFPASAGPAADDEDATVVDGPTGAAIAAATAMPLDEAAQTDRFVRRQRADALMSLRALPVDLFKPRMAMRPAGAALVAALLLAPVLLIPNPQHAVIAQARQEREAAQEQARRLDDLAKELEDKGADANDPRTRLAQELRDLARQLRDRPGDLDVNLAKLGSVESDVRSRVDPATEQRAAALASLSRALSRSATGQQNANPDGDPKQTQEDLDKLGRQARRDDARAAGRSRPPARRAGGDRQRRERRRVDSPPRCGTEPRAGRYGRGQGRPRPARRSAHRVQAAGRREPGPFVRRVATPGRPARPRRRRQARHCAERPGAAGPGPGEPRREPRHRSRPGPGSGQPGRKRSRPGARPGAGPGPGARSGSRPGPRSGPGARPGPGSRPGSRSGPRVRAKARVRARGRARGRARIGGGGSNARSLGNGTGGNGQPAGPTNPNRPSELGDDLVVGLRPVRPSRQAGRPVLRRRHRRRRPDPAGQRHGPGHEQRRPDAVQQVYPDFDDYAQTSLDRGYVPLSVKDYVRDYFSSLDPTK